MDFVRRTWAEIDLNALDYNFRKISADASSPVMAVVKANAYGHGDRVVAAELEKMGACAFAVSNLDEAEVLRSNGIRTPILILGYTAPEYVTGLSKYDITQAVLDFEYAKMLSSAAVAAGVQVNVHIKADTGMSRIGFTPDRTDEIKHVISMENIIVTGIFTHFAVSDCHSGTDFTKLQFDRFMKMISLTETDGFKYKTRHCCNSAALLKNPGMHLDMVRAGIILYGLSPDAGEMQDLDLKPVMSLRSLVSQVKTIPSGTTVSYGRTYKAEKDTVVATVPVGYADGYPRVCGNRTEALVGGKRARVIGRVCMDQLMLDVTGIPVHTGDTVTLFGKDGDEFISVDDISSVAGTINYETVCLITERVPRVYVRDGQTETITHEFTGKF